MLETVAVNVTVWPCTEGSADERTDVLELAAFTVRTVGPPTVPKSAPSPK